jgi:tetraacyldisaccharide 4'-kinase
VSLAERIDGIWYGPGERGVLPALLGAASLIYGAGYGVREALYRRGLKRSRRLGLPCVAVGNLVVGGSGKTPLVSWIISFFQERGLKPAVISRGYGGSVRRPERVAAEGTAGASRLYGDEPVMLARRHPEVPVVVGRDRPAAGREALERWGAGVVVADDAFQHRRLKRDLDIVVIDAGRFFGNGRLFPAGPLREHPRELVRAHVVLLTRVRSAGEKIDSRRRELRRLAPGAVFAEAELLPSGWKLFGEERIGAAPPGGPLFAFCGLANPGSFRGTLEEMGRSPGGWKSYPDHHAYRPEDLAEVAGEAAASGAAAVVTTEKDAARIAKWESDLPLLVLEVRLEIVAGRGELEEKLLAAAGGKGR